MHNFRKKNRLLPVETVPHPIMFELGASELAFCIFLIAYN